MSNKLATYEANTLWDGIQQFIVDAELGKLKEVYTNNHRPEDLKKYALPPFSAIFNTVGRESWYLAEWNGLNLEISLARVKRREVV